MLTKLKLPVIVAPMFLVSSTESVIASCRNGVVGSIPLLNARTEEKCEEMLADLKAALPTEPWAVNFIAHKTNKRHESDLDLIRKYEPPVVIVSLGHPGTVTEVVHGYGGLVFSDVITVKHAKKAAEAGVDGLILVCAGAGGHAGTLNPFAFIDAVREFWDGYIILAGGISSGKDILAAQIMGADFAYMGTKFIPAEESVAFPEYKEMLVDSSIADIIYTDSFSGVNANYLVPSLLKNNIDPTSLKPRDMVDLSHMVDAKAWRDIWSAGHGVTTVKSIDSTAVIIDRLVKEYEEAKKTKKIVTVHA
ncbi:nitronate monooxygenase family protein [Psychrobacillus sp. OK032]|uniref:NAD(P)H-dependent flavin oxidoreductase n=1 Tax=Psychrobacillus sp. OK032 TaxID=1884358 RepID=UPI0008C68DE1|nr:nitronate monooxygenase [Psychrobacillus sp. OK032]SER67709.1 nitronate monooxygenase [Psychrobacillus sp. OK032]